MLWDSAVSGVRPTNQTLLNLKGKKPLCMTSSFNFLSGNCGYLTNMDFPRRFNFICLPAIVLPQLT